MPQNKGTSKWESGPLFRRTVMIRIIYIKAIWVIDQVGLQAGLRALNDRVRMNFMCEKPTKAII